VSTLIRRNVLFSAVNEQEAACLIPIARSLAERTGGNVNVEFVTFDDVFHQQVTRCLDGLPHFAFQTSLKFPRPFYYASHLQRMRFLLRHRRKLGALADRYDAFVCGFGSLPQRVIAGAMLRRAKPTFGVINAHVSRAILSEFPNPLLMRLHQMLPAFSDWLPGGVFGSSVVMRHLFVMGDMMRDTLVQYRVRSRVHAVGVPLFEYLFRPQAPITRSHSEPFSILFLTGAFAWHAQRRRHEAQLVMLRGLVSTVKRLGPAFSLLVKIHPRDDSSQYTFLEGAPHVQVATGTMEECLRKSHLVLAVISTALLEAVCMNRVAAFLLTEFQNDAFIGRFVRELDFIPTINSTSELEASLRDLADPAHYAAMLHRQHASIDRCVSPTTPQSARMIAATICHELSDR
jgi:hypothetical protein